MKLSITSVFLLLLVVTIANSLGLAQENELPKTKTATPTSKPIGVTDEAKPVTVAEVDAKLKEIDSLELEEAEIASLKETLAKAKQQAQMAATLAKKVAEYQQQSSSASENLARVKKELERKLDSATPVTDGKSATEIQGELSEKTIRLEQLRQELIRLTSEPSRRQARLLEIPKLLSEAQEKLESAKSQLTTVGAATAEAVGSTESLAVSNLLQAARRYTARLEVAAVESERNYYSASGEVLPLQRQLVEKQIAQLDEEVKAWQAAIGEIRSDRIAELGESIKQLRNRITPVLKPALESNQEWLQNYRDKSKQLTTIQSKLNESKSKLKEIETDAKTSAQRIEAVGLNNTLGLMLRRRKPNLISLRRDHLPTAYGGAEMEAMQVDLFALQDTFDKTSDTDESVSRLFDEVDVPLDQRPSLVDEAKEVLAQRREVLAPLIETQSALFNSTLELDTADRLLVVEIDKFITFIDEHILWIRSAPIFGQGAFSTMAASAKWLVKPSNLTELTAAFSESARRKLSLVVVLSLVICITLFYQRRIRRNIEEAGELASIRACRTFTPTLTATLNTFVLATYWPIFMIAAGWMLLNIGNDGFVRATSRSLIMVGLAVFPFECIRQICRNKGLGESHFGWSEETRRFLRRNLRWLNPTITVLLFLVVLFQYQPDESFRNSLGRLIMIALLSVWGVYVWKVLHPASLLYRQISTDHRLDGWYRHRWIRFYVVFAIVIALLIFTIAGYYYSTYEIGSRLIKTHALLVGFLFGYEFAMRWLLVRRRNLKMEQLILRREEQAKKANAEAALGSQANVDVQAELGIDAESVSKQTSQLLVISMALVAFWVAWQIWADVLPAIGILEKVELWPVLVAGTVEKVTLQHVFFSLLAITITVFAVKNLPGILELLLLKRLPLDSGSRYAVATIFRYLATIVGVIIACSFLKIQWSQFSWLLAAISVGLGFGLQEIVANFVSGLILLLERPVRIGDIVTIEGTTGVVTKIQMRATTVTNWDQQELVVPNKNLITNSIFNWTLSNVLTRITLDVGVAYGTDPERTQALIMEVVKGHPLVIEDPAPTVIFQTFGDSSLNFVVRCCISGPDKRLSTIHDLQVGINRQLADHDIEIPFPQRVLHTISPTPKVESVGAAISKSDHVS